MLPLTRFRKRTRFFGVSGPSLAFDFANNGPFDPRITFTRASTATFFDSAGVLQSAAIDVPRLDYDPATLAARGLLIEEQRTNLVLQSEDFATTWVTGAPYSVSTNTETAPDGLQTADSLIVASGQSSFNTAVTRQVVSKAASSIQYTRSAFCKALGSTTSVRFVDFGATTLDHASVIVSLIDGSVITAASTVGSFSNASVVVSNAGNGWWRVSLTYTTDAHTSVTVRSFPYVGTSSLIGDGSSGLYIWGAQLEAGAFPTSYIPTTTTALTRSADVAAVNTLSPWFNGTEGTLFAEASWVGLTTARQTVIINNSASPSADFISIQTNPSTATTGRSSIVVGGVAQAGMNISGAFTAGVVFKAATAYKQDDFAFTVNGVTPATDTSGTLPTVDRMQLGALITTTANIWLSRFTYYPRRLSNAELVSITS